MLLKWLENTLFNQLNPLMVAQLYENQHNRNQLITLLKEFTDKIGLPNQTYQLIAGLNAKDYITTNYDHLIPETLKARGLGFITIVDDLQIAYADSNQIKILKMHGSLQAPFSPDSIIFTRNDFEAYDLKKPNIHNYIQTLLTTRTVLMLGYSINDPNFLMIRDRVRHYLNDHSKIIYFVTFDMPDYLVQYWRSGGFYPINLDGSDKSASLDNWLKEVITLL